MSAFLELRQLGKLGPLGAAMLYDAVKVVARSGNFPPPGGGRWTVEVLRETAHDYVVDQGYPRRLASLYLRASDDDSMRNLLHAHVRNWLRSRSRATERGRMLERVRRAARSVNRFVEVNTVAGRAIAFLEHADQEPWTGRLSDLHVTAAKVPVRTVRWRSDRRRDPEADDESFRAVLIAALQAADAPLLFADVIDVFAHKFALYAAPIASELDDEPADWSTSPEAATVSQATADDVWTQLSVEERRTLAAYGPVRDMAVALGRGKSRAHVMRQRLHDLLGRLLRDDADAEAVIDDLVERARLWNSQADDPPR